MQRSTTNNLLELQECSWREGEGIIEAREVRIMMYKSIEKAQQSSWKQLWRLQGTKLGTPYMRDICEAWTKRGASGNKAMIQAWYSNYLVPFWVIMQGRATGSCPNVLCQTMLTTHRSPYPWGVVARVWAKGNWGRVGGSKGLWDHG